MKTLALILIFLSFTISAFASNKICSVQAAISLGKDGGYTYVTGIGPTGADENSITPLNQVVDDTLAKAAKEMKSYVEVCMTGTFLRLGKSFQFLVYSAVEKAL